MTRRGRARGSDGSGSDGGLSHRYRPPTDDGETPAAPVDEGRGLDPVPSTPSRPRAARGVWKGANASDPPAQTLSCSCTPRAQSPRCSRSCGAEAIGGASAQRRGFRWPEPPQPLGREGEPRARPHPRKGRALGKRQRAGEREESGTKPRAGSQRSKHHCERPNGTVGTVGTVGRDQAAPRQLPGVPGAGVAWAGGHTLLKTPRPPCLLPQAVVPELKGR